jgi:hypothetical protein
MGNQDISVYYSNGLTKEFFERFKHVKVSLPNIPSTSSLGPEISRVLSQRQSKVFFSPCREAFSWRNGSSRRISIPVDFWKDVSNKLVSSGFFPVIFSDHFSYDLKAEIEKDCLHISGTDVAHTMAAMRSSGCVLDFFGDISRIAMCARTPFLCFEERAKYNGLKEYEINDLCGKGVSKEYIFGFAAILESGDRSAWNSNFLDHMVVRLKKIQENTDREKWPSTAEQNDIVAYDSVRKIKKKKFSSRFIRVER